MLVLVPTRELCIQVGKEIMGVAEPLGFNVGMLYGGRDIGGDYKTTKKKIHIMVGTPGRLIQHVNEKNIKVGEVKLLVYDESDQMFDNGFAKECAYVKTRVSKNCQIVLSSATITDKVKKFVDNVIVDHEFLEVGMGVPPGIVQEKMFCEIKDKKEELLKFLSKKKFSKAMVFCNKKDRSETVAEFLNENGIFARALNANLEQNERLDRLNLFKDGKIKVLIVTDVAARGLQIEKVDIVVNYDVPTRAEFYVHRIGRSGRRGKKGYAMTMVCPEDDDRFANIEFEYEIDVKEIK